MENEREKDEAIRIIQWNFDRWQDLNKSKWWKLFIYIRPLIPAASVDAREHRLKEHLAQLELELDELRSEHSRAQLELESAQKSKQIAEKWSEEIGQINKKLMGELKEAEEKLKKSVKTTEQINAPYFNYMVDNCAETEETGTHQQGNWMELGTRTPYH
uniref:Uncharacterized protein n=1 Tax=Meloidogyne javanica TaxID=6303 RepID=A0A915NB13_MELJA